MIQVTFRDPESANRACVDPNPVIDGRRANCNIASLGRPRPSPPRGDFIIIIFLNWLFLFTYYLFIYVYVYILGLQEEIKRETYTKEVKERHRYIRR